MKYAVSLLALMVSNVLNAAQSVNQDMAVTNTVTVNVEVVRGNINVMGWDKASVKAEGTLDEKSEAFIFEKRGENVVIRDKVPNNLNRGNGTQLTVYIPRAGNIEVDAVSADIQLKDIAGRVELSSVSGNIKAEKAGHEVELESVSGDLDLTGAGRDVSLQTVSGNITAHVTATRLTAESISGDIQLRNEGVLQRGDYSTISGDARIESALSDEVDVEMESVSGSLVLTVRGDVNARVNAETGPGGDIRNELSGDEPDEAEFTGAESLEIKLGNGKGRIDASVVSGDIEFRKK